MTELIIYLIVGWVTGFLLGVLSNHRGPVAAQPTAEIPKHVNGEVMLSGEYQAGECASSEYQQAKSKMKAALSGLAFELNRQPVLFQVGIYGALLYCGLMFRQRGDKSAHQGSEAGHV